MAQTDTGLGWSAKDTYTFSAGNLALGSLKQSTSEFFNDPEHPEWLPQPLPYDPTITQSTDAAYIVAHGVLLGKGTSGGTTKTVYAIAKNPDTFIWHEYGGWNAFTTTLGGYIRMVFRTGNNVDAYASITTNNTNFYNTYGLYYGSATRNQSFANMYIPSNTGKSTTYIAGTISITSTDYYKLNPGFAVCCFARYNDANGKVKVMPVLISSVEQNTVISTDGVNPASSVMLMKLYDGVRFYMRYIVTPDDVIISGNTVPEAILTNFSVLAPAGVFNALFRSDWANIIVTSSVDPYNAPDNEPAGGDGEGDNPDDVDFPLPPSIGAVNSGFLTLFLPSLIQLNGLANYMWTNDFDLDTIRKMFANPMDAILGCYILPLSPAITGSKAVRVAGIAIPNTTWNYTVEEYITLTCGSVTIPKDTGSYLDYMTKLQIFLPYIGFREISPDDCMGKTLTLQYNIHVLSGACVASLKCGNTVLYNWAGQCSMQIPVNGTDLSSAISAAIGIAASAVSLAVSEGVTAPMVAGTIASAAVNSFALKPNISRGGSISGAAGFLAKQIPYIVRSNPVMAKPGRQNEFIGYPSYVTMELGTLTGYNEIDSIHLENVPGTDAELSEIETLLKSGVIF